MIKCYIMYNIMYNTIFVIKYSLKNLKIYINTDHVLLLFY